MITVLKKLYKRVGAQNFERGLQNICKLIALAFLFALFANILSSCEKTQTKVYEVKTSGVAYQTSEENKRLKEPVETQAVYLIVEGDSN